MPLQQDFLDEDPAIRGQGYVCLSFLSPEDVIVQKETFAFKRFLGTFAKDLGDMFDNLSAALAHDKAAQDMLTNVRARYEYVSDARLLHEEFEFFKGQNSKDIDEAFGRENEFRTSVRGIKVRGTYETFAEAENRCKQIKRFDDKFDVYVAQVGCWCPWAPRPDVIENQEYAEEQLNTLMKKYTESLQARDEVYKARMEAMKARAGEAAPAKPVDTVEAIGPDEALSTIAESEDAWLAARAGHDS